MLLGFRSNISFHRPLHLLSSRFPFIFNNSISSSSSSQHSNRDDFLPWLQSKSGFEISTNLSIGNSIYGRSLFASESIRAGDCMLKVPFSVHLTSDYLIPEINSSLNNEIGHVSRLAIVILIEHRKGQDSEWAPYISSLPQAGDMHSTIFWSTEELEMIRQSSVYLETVNQKAQLEKEYWALRPVLDQFPQIFEDITYKDFVHAFALVASRAWGSSKTVSLVPFADFLNHDGFSETMLLTNEHKQMSEVIADQDYAPGNQVLVRYGKFPNSTLLLDFGFALSYNIYDQVQIQINVPQHDHLRAFKLDLVNKHSSSVATDTTSSNSFQNSFILKEVRSARGKGKGISQSLRAFARVLCADTYQELKDLELEATQGDGRLARSPLKNTSKEIESHRLLHSQITHLIHDYDASIQSVKLINCDATGGTFGHRKQMALDLLTGEVRVLRSAAAWLNNYCSTLSNQTVAVH